MQDIRPRNVLLVSADQWRGDCLGAVGHPIVKTPHLDALARDGVLFKNHFTQCTPCGPARTSLLTGLYMMTHRSVRNGTPLDGRHTNLAKEMRRAGFDPVLFGYTDTALDPRALAATDMARGAYDEGVMPGFKPAVLMSERMAPWIDCLRRRGHPLPDGRQEVFKPRPGFALPAGRGYRFIPPVYNAADSDSAFMADSLLNWLPTTEDRPWFAHLVFMRPHPPFIAPEPYNALYDPAAMTQPRRAPDSACEAAGHPFLRYARQRLGPPGNFDEHSPLDPNHLSDLELRQMRAAYFGLITEVDHQLGRIIEHLKETGDYDRTLIIFTSDHGEMLGDHHLWGKEVFFDPAMHIPLIIRDPDPVSRRGRMIEAFSQSIDIMPTILDRLGLPVPSACDGRPLSPFLHGFTPPDWRREVFWEHDFREIDAPAASAPLGLRPDDCSYAVVRDRAYKYVHFAALPPLLFDLRVDPFEMDQVAGLPAYRQIELEYAQKMLSWRLSAVDRAMTHSLLTPDGKYIENLLASSS
jgi:arylsulfatase A-like enzyme